MALSPDCGFVPGRAAEISTDEADAAIESGVAARLLRERHPR